MQTGLMNDSSTGSAPPATSTHHRLGQVLIGAAVFLVAGASVGVFTHFGGMVWPDRLLTHPILFGVAASLVGGYGLALVTGAGPRAPATVLAWLVAVLWALGGWAAWNIVGQHEVARVEEPGGQLQAVALEGTNVIDSYWLIYVEQADRGPLDHSFYVGCVNGDWQDLYGLTWVRGSLLVHSSSGDVTVKLDRDGRPQQHERTSVLGTGGRIFGGCS